VLKLAPPGDEEEVDDMRSASLPSRALADAIEARDLYEVAWDLLAESVNGEPRNASLISTLIRVLASLGSPPLDDERALAEAALRGLVMNGLAPRNPKEWALAEETFDDDTLADLRQREAIEKRLR
jgi:hypothetical protein